LSVLWLAASVTYFTLWQAAMQEIVQKKLKFFAINSNFML